MANPRLIRIASINGVLVKNVAARHQWCSRKRRTRAATGQEEEAPTLSERLSPPTKERRDLRSMIGTSSALAIKTVESGRHLAKHVDVKVQAIHGRRRAQAPHRADAQSTRIGESPDAFGALPQPAKDVADLGIDPGHAASIVHICEQRKSTLRNDQAAFTPVNPYDAIMTLAALIARRGHRVLEVRGFDQKVWAKNAKVAEGTLSGMLAVRYDKFGGIVTPSLVTVSKACAAADVPLWAFLHSDDGVLELFLSNRGPELMEIERAGGYSAAMTACMAILDELRPTALQSARERRGA